MASRKNIDIDKAIDLYVNQKMPTTQVSKIIGCCVQTLITRLRECDVVIRSCGNHKEKVSLEIIKHEYVNLEMSITEIATKHNMAPTSILERLTSGGVQLRNRKEMADKANIKIPVSEHSEICQRYIDNPSDNAAIIAKDYDVHRSTITTILKKGGIAPENFGARSHSWKGGITPLHSQIRNCEQAQQWKRACMERDNFTCMSCSIKGGKLHVHHIEWFTCILEGFLMLNLNSNIDKNRLFDLALEYEPFWNIDNGTTMCENCHNEHHGRSLPSTVRANRPPKKDINVDKVIELYNSGMTATAVAKEVGTVASVLLKLLREYDIPIRHFASYKIGCVPIVQICHEYEILKMTTTQIAQKHGVTRSNIQKRLKKAGVTMRDHWGERRKNQS